MNPFSDISKIDESQNLPNYRLITIGSKCGDGKTLAIHTIVMNYINSGINVLLFSETQARSTEFLFRNIDVKRNENKKLGNLITFNLIFETALESFHKKIIYYAQFMVGGFVIIIDGPMLDFTKESFSYIKFGENTRFVIFEKFNLKKELSYVKKEEENPYIRNKKNAESLRELAVRFNTHVIITNQHSNSIHINGDEQDLINNRLILPTMLTSDAYFTINKLRETTLVNNKESSMFLVSCEKNRYSKNSTKTCVLDSETLTLATI
jgi:hypothetical protein